MNATTHPGQDAGAGPAGRGEAGPASGLPPPGGSAAAPESCTIGDLEQAINFWRRRLPSRAGELRLCAPAAALAEPYARLILAHGQQVEASALTEAARAALEGWRQALAVEVPVQDR